MKPEAFDVLVIGAGHAGIEAALAPARLGLKVAIITTNLSRIGYMSCNPSIGGLGKGHIVREIDILGGEMGFAADQSCIQFKRLNSARGPAVRGSRAQCDKTVYSNYMTSYLKSFSNIRIINSEAKSLILKNGECNGVYLDDGSEVYGHATVLTTGTFMRAIMFLGLEREAGGRVGDKATVGISDQLIAHGFNVYRLKTGTPPRLKKASIDFSKTIPQLGDERFIPFSFRSAKKVQLEQVPCFLSYTNEKTHDIIRENLDKSPMFIGHIEGSGPRYCPSIEDKITRFSDKISHQTFLEPESLSSDLIYLQGISTSLPLDIQYKFLRTIPGLGNVEIAQPGYAVEYDFIEPTQIKHNLETRSINNLFLAGQINGTSGYEEAAGQGLVAGVNASMKVLGKEALKLGRHESYIGVLIDDLVTKGTREPYRMFTSRAEHRLVLREDNTIDRLAAKAASFGLLSDVKFEALNQILDKRIMVKALLDDTKIVPNEATQLILDKMGTARLQKQTTLSDLLRRPELTSKDLHPFVSFEGFDIFEIVEPSEISIKYDGYISRQNELIRQGLKLENMAIPAAFDYHSIKGLKQEEREKLTLLRPETVGQAKRISGVNPSAIQAIIIAVKAMQRVNSFPPIINL